MDRYCVALFGIDLGTCYSFVDWDYKDTNDRSHPYNRFNNRNEYKKIKNLHKVKRLYRY